VHLTETEVRDQYGNIKGYYHTFRVHTTGRGVVIIEDREIGDGEELGRTIIREVKRYEVLGRLRQALVLENAGHREAAIFCFEQLLRECPYNEIAHQAKEHLRQLRGGEAVRE